MAETEARPGWQVVQAVAERHRATRRPRAGTGAGQRLGVVVVSVHEQKLETGAAKKRAGGAQEAASFRFAWEVAEVAERDERVATLLDGALDQRAQVASVAVQVAEYEQSGHGRSPSRLRSANTGRGVPRGAPRVWVTTD